MDLEILCLYLKYKIFKFKEIILKFKNPYFIIKQIYFVKQRDKLINFLKKNFWIGKKKLIFKSF